VPYSTKMGQCVTVNVGNSGAVLPSATEAPSSGTNVSIGNSKEDGGEDDEEEEEDEGICSCIESGNCLPWV